MKFDRLTHPLLIQTSTNMSTGAGRPSPFSKEQDEYIEGFFPALLAQDPTTVDSWKTTKVEDILKSPLFLGKLPAKKDENDSQGGDEKEWKRVRSIQFLPEFRTDGSS